MVLGELKKCTYLGGMDSSCMELTQNYNKVPKMSFNIVERMHNAINEQGGEARICNLDKIR